MTTSSSSSMYTIPPSWYLLQTSPAGTPFISLPQKDITTLPVFLTPFFPCDVSPMHMLLSHPPTNRALISVPCPYTLSDADSWIQLQLSGSRNSCLPLQALRSYDPDS